MFTEKRKPTVGSMIQTRLLIGLISIAHGIGGAWLQHGVGVSLLTHTLDMGWILPASLCVFGAGLTIVAAREMLGRHNRLLHELSYSVLGAVWLFVWAYSFRGGADYVTFTAPVYIAFIIWSAIAEAKVARQTAMYQKTFCSN